MTLRCLAAIAIVLLVPFPQRTVFHRAEPGSGVPESLSMPSRIVCGTR